MRERLSLVVLAASALLFLADLYLPWQQAPQWPAWDGWTSVGDAVAVAAIVVTVATGFAMLRPDLTGRLPLGRATLVFGYLGLACAAAVRADARGVSGPRFHTAYGTYLGVGCSLVALGTAAVLRRREIAHARAGAIGAVLSIGVLVSLLLPWQAQLWRGHVVNVLGIEHKPGELAAVAACIAAASWARLRGAEQLGLAAATAVLTGAALTPYADLAPVAPRTYGAWLGLACAASLLVLGLFGTRDAAGLRPSLLSAAIVAAAGVLVFASYLPWTSVCSGHWDNPPQECAIYGWTDRSGAGAAGLALLVAVGLVFRRFGVRPLELLLGIVLLVTTHGFELAADPDRHQFRYGSYLGFAAAGLILMLALLQLRRPTIERGRVGLSLFAGGVCVAYAVLVVVPWWQVLPAHWQWQSIGRSGGVSWTSVAALVLILRLLGTWTIRARGLGGSSEELVLVPLALLGFAVLDFVDAHELTVGVSWGDGIALGLSLTLALLGWFDQRGASAFPRSSGSTAYPPRASGNASITSLATRP